MGMYDLAVLMSLLRVFHKTFLKIIGCHLDYRHWRPQLVRHAKNELRLHFCESARPFRQDNQHADSQSQHQQHAAAQKKAAATERRHGLIERAGSRSNEQLPRSCGALSRRRNWMATVWWYRGQQFGQGIQTCEYVNLGTDDCRAFAGGQSVRATKNWRDGYPHVGCRRRRQETIHTKCEKTRTTVGTAKLAFRSCRSRVKDNSRRCRGRLIHNQSVVARCRAAWKANPQQSWQKCCS